jgi:hypothetical protein
MPFNLNSPSKPPSTLVKRAVFLKAAYTTLNHFKTCRKFKPREINRHFWLCNQSCLWLKLKILSLSKGDFQHPRFRRLPTSQCPECGLKDKTRQLIGNDNLPLTISGQARTQLPRSSSGLNFWTGKFHPNESERKSPFSAVTISWVWTKIQMNHKYSHRSLLLARVNTRFPRLALFNLEIESFIPLKSDLTKTLSKRKFWGLVTQARLLKECIDLMVVTTLSKYGQCFTLKVHRNLSSSLGCRIIAPKKA